MSSESVGNELAALRAEVAILRERALDSEDELRRLQSQHDVLESFCFALERDHDLAASRLVEAQAQLKQTLAGVRRLKAEQDDILTNVKQGILIVGQDLRIHAGYSRVTEAMLGRRDLAGLPFVELFAADLEPRIVRYLEMTFSAHHASNAMLERLNPLREHSRVVIEDGAAVPRLLAFSFARIAKTSDAGVERERSSTDGIEKIMVVVTDRTAEFELNQRLARRAAEESAKVAKVYQLVTLPADVVRAFIVEARDALARLAAVDDAAAALRIAHALKGNARALGLDSVAAAAHGFEDALASRGAAARSAALVKLRAEVEDGEQLFSRLLGLRSALASTGIDVLEGTLQSLVRAEAPAVGKQVELRYGAELPRGLPPALAFRVKATLVQLVRNAVAHGIEEPAERRARDKPATGRIDVRVCEARGAVEVSCRDDGRGVDVHRLRQRAVERGLVSAAEAASLDDERSYELMFCSGMTTAEHVTELAGRGVGLDLVREHVRSVGGTVRVVSVPASHTELTLHLPFPDPFEPALRDRTTA